MSSQKIKEIALNLFTEKGYEGTSLSDIAGLVGIKKSSIYNHYSSKDELFLAIFEMSYYAEILNTRKTFERSNISILDQLKDFMDIRISRLSNNTTTKFLFRFIIYPPYHLKAQIELMSQNFFNEIHSIITEAMKNSIEFHLSTDEQINEQTSLYNILLEGLLLDVLYGHNNQVQLRKESAWTIFHNTISNDLVVK